MCQSQCWFPKFQKVLTGRSSCYYNSSLHISDELSHTKPSFTWICCIRLLFILGTLGDEDHSVMTNLDSQFEIFHCYWAVNWSQQFFRHFLSKFINIKLLIVKINHSFSLIQYVWGKFCALLHSNFSSQKPTYMSHIVCGYFLWTCVLHPTILD